MNIFKTAILIVLFKVICMVVFAQASTDDKLASYYYNNGEFDKAAIYYERLYNRTPSNNYYKFYFKSLIALENYKTSLKLVKKQIKKYPGNSNYILDHGRVEHKLGNYSKAKKLYEKAIKELPKNQHQIIKLARAFAEMGEIAYALDTYERGKKLLRGQYHFNIEIADIYGSLDKHEEMIAEYLDLLEISNAYIQQVQNVLNRNLSFEKKTKQNEILRVSLLKRIQKNPQKIIFAELLIWMFMQQNNLQQAMIQTKALDKRNKEQGNRVMALARICVKNKQYDQAVKGYMYVMEKGAENIFFTKCKIQLLRVKNMKVQENLSDTVELLALDKQYTETLLELGSYPSTIPLMKDQALLKAYRLHNIADAMLILEKAIVVKNIKPHDRAELKLLKGDLMLVQGEIWDASLLYGQVEKQYKYDRLGEKAKFKNAIIGYYTGNFRWAKGLLDVLKGSTSKLIANDAMKLSLLITDNSTVDTTTVPLLMYARADFLMIQNRHNEAILTLDSINKIYPFPDANDPKELIIRVKGLLLIVGGRVPGGTFFIDKEKALLYHGTEIDN